MEQQNASQNKSSRGTKARASAIDAIIILLLLAAVAGIAYRVIYAFNRRDSGNTGTVYAVAFTVEETYASVLGELRDHDVLYLAESGAELGTVAAYRNEDSTITSSIVITPGAKPGYATAKAELRCAEAVRTDGGSDKDVVSELRLENCGIYLTPGTKLTVYTEQAVLHITVTGIRATP